MKRILCCFVFLSMCLPGRVSQAADQTGKPAPAAAAVHPSVYDFSLVDLEGKPVSLSTYKGKVLLIVNLASQSTYSDQIAALNDLSKTYAAKGLVVLGIPSRDFGGLELQDLPAIRKHYLDELHTTFPVFAPSTLHGVEALPLIHFLTDAKTGLPGGDLHWNYTKFLIDRDGKPLARYEVSTDPADVDFHVVIESALDGKFKKAGGKHPEAPDAGGDDEED